MSLQPHDLHHLGDLLQRLGDVLDDLQEADEFEPIGAARPSSLSTSMIRLAEPKPCDVH